MPHAVMADGNKPDSLMNGGFPENLRYLCSYYHSVSEVCRRLGINRQQFNKYVFGVSRPSSHNLKKICDFFGVEEYEILFPHNKLREIIEIKGIKAGDRPKRDAYVDHMDMLFSISDPDIEKYYGYYHKYYYSFSYPGKILKSLLHIHELDGRSYFKCVERLVERPSRGGQGFVFKYVGVVLFLRERIFMIDHETLTGHEISETILYPSYKNKVGELSGLMIGAAGNTSREPICSRVLLRSLGPQIDVGAAMRACGLYADSSPDIDETVRRAVDNTVAEGEFTIRAVPR